MNREALTGHRLCQHHGSGLSLQNSEKSVSSFISHQPTWAETDVSVQSRIHD